jgi:diguanylate cyclase (GGDEF)-like protein
MSGESRKGRDRSADHETSAWMENVVSSLGSGWPSYLMVGAFLVLVASLVMSTLASVEERIVQKSAEQLASVCRGIRAGHVLWAEGRKGDVRTLAASPTLIDGLLIVLAEDRDDEAGLAMIRRRIEAHVSTFDFSSSVAVLSREGETIASVGSAADRARTFAAKYPLQFERAKRGLVEVLLVPDEAPNARKNEVEGIAAAPILDDDGTTLGVIVWDFDATPSLAELASIGRFGRTSRAFVFDELGHILIGYGLSPEVLEQRGAEGRTGLIVNSLRGSPAAHTDEYVDETGEPVIGAAIWDDGLSLGMAVELSREEAFGTYFELRNVIVGALVTMAALCLVLLTILGTARSRVVRGLESSRARLEKIVEERTSALAELNRELRLEAERRMRHAWELETAREALEIANRKLEILASRDALTGLANRRAFEIALEREWQRAMRTRTPIGLLMVDVDHFKTLNDTQGHPAGDDALRRIGAILRAGGFARRPGDLICRHGGEEFAILLEDASAEHVRETAERVRRAILEERIHHPATQVEGLDVVSVSVGAASVVPLAGEDADLLVALADKALYRAKNEGRNRVARASLDEKTDPRRRPLPGGQGPEA